MLLFINLAITKTVIFLSELIGRGTTFPGKLARKIDKNITKKIKMPKFVIAVTGSSGKGSTTKMIASSFKSAGYSVLYNYKSSNVSDAILTCILKGASFNGKVNKDVAIFEVDERYSKYVFPYIKPNYVVITNITRDQPPRQGHFDLVFKEIKKAITKDMHLVINSDDPYLYKFNKLGNTITYYGINDNKYSFTKNTFNGLNMVYCPNCGMKLEYSKYHFENLGHFKCPNCSFKRIEPSYVVNKIDYKNNLLTINDDKIKINNPMLFNIYNVLAAYTVCKLNNISTDIFSDLQKDESLFDYKEINNRKFYCLNNKNENATTFNQSINFINRDKGLKTIVIGWNEISRRYKFNDLSWLYDIDFEALKKHKIDKIICTGTNKYDIAVRIKQCGFENKKIVCFDDLECASDTILNKTKGNVYAILNFDYVKPFKKIIGGDDK